jgi:hypothetical protein
MEKTELKERYRNLEVQLKFNSTRKETLENSSLLIRKEISRIEDRIDQITKELLLVIDDLRKSEF